MINASISITEGREECIKPTKAHKNQILLILIWYGHLQIISATSGVVHEKYNDGERYEPKNIMNRV